MTPALNDTDRRALRRKARESTLRALHALGGEATRGAIHDWALQNTKFTEIELNAPAPRAAGDRYPTLLEHDLSWSLTTSNATASSRNLAGEPGA